MSYVNGLYGLGLCVEKYNTDTRPIEDIMEELYDEITKDIVDDGKKYDLSNTSFPYCYYYNLPLFNDHARFLLENRKNIERQSYMLFMGRTTKLDEIKKDVNSLVEEIEWELFNIKHRERSNLVNNTYDVIDDIKNTLYNMKEKEKKSLKIKQTEKIIKKLDNIIMFKQIDNMIKQLECVC